MTFASGIGAVLAFQAIVWIALLAAVIGTRLAATDPESVQFFERMHYFIQQSAIGFGDGDSSRNQITDGSIAILVGAVVLWFFAFQGVPPARRLRIALFKSMQATAVSSVPIACWVGSVVGSGTVLIAICDAAEVQAELYVGDASIAVIGFAVLMFLRTALVAVAQQPYS
ncbi:MAG: hypothetical protein L6Q92_16840 [Phycisphaerae bacterium]|nr:hypothetical protein [Phycisphaerae bacterium]